MSRQAKKDAAAAARDLLKVDAARVRKAGGGQLRKPAAAPMRNPAAVPVLAASSSAATVTSTAPDGQTAASSSITAPTASSGAPDRVRNHGFLNPQIQQRDSSMGADRKNEQYWTDVEVTYNETTPSHRARNAKQIKDRFHKIY
nr:unnamed protein product [Digitaria exilis]